MSRHFEAVLGAALLSMAPLAPVSAQLGSYNPEPGPQETVAIRNATVFPMDGDPITAGTVVFSSGKIVAIGSDVEVPGDARLIDGTGLFVYPGMMDAGTSMGLAEITQGAAGTVDRAETGNWNPNVKALWGIDPHSAHIGVTRVVGITHVISRPTGGILAGKAALINMGGYTATGMAVVPEIATVIQLPGQRGRFGRFGGESSDNGGSSGMSPLDSLRMILDDARAYGKAEAAYAADSTLPRPTTDLKLASLQAVLAGTMPAIFPAQSESDIRKAVEFAESEEIRPVILGGRDSWRMTDYLVEHDVPVVFTGVLDLPPRDDDPYDAMYHAPVVLREAGVKFAIASGEPNPDVRNLPYHAGMAAAFGLDHDDAIKAVTIWPAEIFGVGGQLGTIAPGKIANLVVTDGDLLEAHTNTRYLFIDGRNVPLATKHSELYDHFKNRKLPQ